MEQKMIIENVKTLVGSRIKEIRKRKKLTQEKLAEMVGIEPNNLCRIENGKNFPTPENLAKISKSLEIEVFELFLYEHLTGVESQKAALLKAIENDDGQVLTGALFKFYQAVR
ncbi:hypothetical protein tpqmel_0045 [Candidatus Gastranaerophilus sp. (ex Termes propinquus)]|nr:hypothetical protein tpqmel_0045 [Candidatus Gastranaerophilus sp. (ex Termes propinquus)]